MLRGLGHGGRGVEHCERLLARSLQRRWHRDFSLGHLLGHLHRFREQLLVKLLCLLNWLGCGLGPFSHASYRLHLGHQLLCNVKDLLEALGVDVLAGILLLQQALEHGLEPAELLVEGAGVGLGR